MYINKIRNILDLNRFNDEAKALNAKIEIVMKLGDDDLRFTISEVLTAQEDSELMSFMAAFEDIDPEDKVPKIMDMVHPGLKSKPVHDIDYKTEIASDFKLIPKRTVTRGEVTRVEWYKTLDANQLPTDLVLVVDVTYTRDATGFALFRNTVRTWINRDESEYYSKKNTTKFYFVNPSDMITEGYSRRKLLVQSVQIPVLTFMIEVLSPLGYNQTSIVLKGRAFMDDYETDFSKFIENSSTVTDPSDPNVGRKNVIVELEDQTLGGRNAEYNQWLDKAPPSMGGSITIRQYLISEFSI